MNARHFVLLTLAVSLLGACTTDQMRGRPMESEGTRLDPGKAYDAKIDQYSDGDTQYSGFYNNFEYRATLLNTEVRNALLTREADYYQWDHEKQLSEHEKSAKEAAAETTTFVSFFTPDRRNDNLSDAKSIWRVYLESGGHRYQGKVKKVRTLLVELQALYPYHTRWNTPYMIVFPVPTNAIETQPSTLTITGPLGTKTVSFKSQQ